MLYEVSLDLDNAVKYAKTWAFSRNPEYYNFDALGGDCTNFISQCLYAAGAAMNFTKDLGWYFLSLDDRAAAWTGVEFFYRFMTRNKGVGPFGSVVPLYAVTVGDVIQLGNSARFYHTLLVVDVRGGVPYLAAHTTNVFNVPLTSYSFERARVLRITKTRRYHK